MESHTSFHSPAISEEVVVVVNVKIIYIELHSTIGFLDVLPRALNLTSRSTAAPPANLNGNSVADA